MLKFCSTCEFEKLRPFAEPCKNCTATDTEVTGRKHNGNITFKKLNGLSPTVESCTMKVLEEVGELMQLIGKGQSRSGENNKNIDIGLWAGYAINEALDVAQAAVTMVHTLCDEYDYSLPKMVDIHEKKLKEKGYLK